MTKDEELEHLRQENRMLRDQVQVLSERIGELEGRLAKDSHNSHLPPSSDRFHRQPNTTLLVSPWTEGLDLIGLNEPEDEILEQPEQHLPMHVRQRTTCA